MNEYHKMLRISKLTSSKLQNPIPATLTLDDAKLCKDFFNTLWHSDTTWLQ